MWFQSITPAAAVRAQYFSRLDLSLEQLHPVAISLLMKAGVINIAVQDFVHHPCVVVGG